MTTGAFRTQGWLSTMTSSEQLWGFLYGSNYLPACPALFAFV
ncbi:uncharacterized protein METZ01_LOCUS159938 [marine metagenome]|uniref:Uncharacterized protein n=1 Tax=marine metagenome TaxID=408172 RepID=A0A382B0G0_9ZZZZ